MGAGAGFEPLRFRRATLDWSRPYIAGILNVTPDSFSDGGRYAELDAAVARAQQLADDGADLIDVGGESTRPAGAVAVDAAEETRRVVPVIEALAARIALPITVDTTKAEVAQAAVRAGAEAVNDISGGQFDPRVPRVAADLGAAYICGHVRGTTIGEVHAGEGAPPGFDEVVAELRERVHALPGPLRDRTVVDPCLGFGKRTAQNLELSARAGQLSAALQYPVMIGASRKRFVGELTGMAVDRRDAGSVGAALAAVAAGAHIVRVHDVAMTRQALTVFEAVRSTVA